MKIHKNYPLAPETTFACGGHAKWFCAPMRLSQFKNLLALHKGKLYILGAGSKTLCPDSGFDGLVISTKNLQNIAFDGDFVVCEAGTHFDALKTFCISHNLSGLEWSSGIPASVGGAVVMNAGSFGHEFSEVVEKVEIFSAGKTQILPASQIQFTYRHSSLKGLPVLRVWLRLTHAPNVAEKYECYYSKKFSTQPADVFSAGSIFKRANGVIPAKIIDKLGLKGAKIGGAQVSSHHSGFIINTGSATATDVIALIDHIRTSAQKTFGIRLENEVIIME